MISLAIAVVILCIIGLVILIILSVRLAIKEEKSEKEYHYNLENIINDFNQRLCTLERGEK